MKAFNNLRLVLLKLAAFILPLFVICLSGIGCSSIGIFSRAKEPAEVKTSTELDSVGEYLRSLKELRETSGTGVVTPDGEAGIEKLRDRFKIPDRIKITSPHGGREVLVFVFDAEDAIAASSEGAEIIPITRYKHLQSSFNIRYVYLLFENEPVRIGDIVYAFNVNSGNNRNRMSVFYNIPGKKISFKPLPEDAALNKDSIFVAGAQYIIRPVAVAE